MIQINSPFRGPGGEKIFNVALCSFGMSGYVFHAPFIHAHPGFNLYAVWERSVKIASTSYPNIISFDTLDVMLSDEAIDMVIVNTPNYTHFDFAKKALQAGKHVLVEKAFTVTVKEALELIQVAKDNNRQLAVFQNRRYDSDFKTVKKIVDEKLLGEIIEAEFHFDRYKPALSPKQHKETAIPGAGLLHDLGPHLIDQALYLFGMPAYASGILRTVRPGSIVNDYFDITLIYDTFSVRLKSSLLVKEILPAYILHGSKGSFIKERADIQEDSLKKGLKPESAAWGLEPETAFSILNLEGSGKISIVSLPGNYMEFYDELYDALKNGNKLPVSDLDGLHVMQVIEAVIESNATKKMVSL